MPNETVGYVISIILVLLVIKHVPGQRLNTFNLLYPLVLVAAAAAYYLRSIPTAGNDTRLYAILIITGLILGIANALASKVYFQTPQVIVARAGFIAAVLWIIGMTARSVFVYWAQHGGEPAITTYSIQHRITGTAAWTAALVFMLMVEVLSRLAALRVRRSLLRQTTLASMPTTAD